MYDQSMLRADNGPTLRPDGGPARHRNPQLLAKGRDDSAMTEDDTGWGGSARGCTAAGRAGEPAARLAGPAGRPPSAARARLAADPGPARSTPGPPGSTPDLPDCARLLAGILVSAGLAVAELADYPDGVGYLAILGVITGAVGGLAAVVVVIEENPRGWVYRTNIVAAWLALISVFTGQHGWYGNGG